MQLVRSELEYFSRDVTPNLSLAILLSKKFSPTSVVMELINHNITI